MSATKHLIVNADDFGQSAGINWGIIEAYEHGIVTSTSLMTRWPAAGSAAQYAREHPELSVGLHLDLGEWTYRNRNWLVVYSVVPLDDAEVVRREIAGQLASFQHLVGKNPTHIDSHQHVHLREPARSALLDLAANLCVPVRHLTPEVHYCGNFYGQSAEGAPLPDLISVQALIKILRRLPEGCTELGCHPAKEIDVDTMYAKERLKELKVLCSKQLREFIAKANVQLCSFYDQVGSDNHSV
jgi:chitin disaccharide deacetylase